MDKEKNSDKLVKIINNWYFSNSFLEKLDRTKTYLVAFSHGPDSTFLVHFLLAKGFKNLILIHINYQKRKEADKEARRVVLFAQEYNLKYHIFKPSYKKNFHHQNFQAYARKIRFNYFLEIAKKYDIYKIFIATTFDDLIENFILRGIKKNYYGLFLPLSLKKYHQLLIYRPLLQTSKKSIINYLNKNNLFYCIDRSNQELIYLRNIIRFQIEHKLNENDKYQIFNNLIIPFLNYYFKLKKFAFFWLKKNLNSKQQLKSTFFDHQNQSLLFLGFNLWLKRELKNQKLNHYFLSFRSFYEILEKLKKQKKERIILFDNFRKWSIHLVKGLIFLKRLNE